MYNHIKEIVAAAEKTHKPISELIIEQDGNFENIYLKERN